MAGMAMSLRVVVPPHPLIAHWLTLLREPSTPAPLFGTALAELGRWLTYEALRDWLPQQAVELHTGLAPSAGTVVDSSVPILALPVMPVGLGLWEGARTVLPAAALAPLTPLACLEGASNLGYGGLPGQIDERVGVLLFLSELGAPAAILGLLDQLAERGVGGSRLRILTALASAPALSALGSAHPQLTVYCAGIDPELDEQERLVPGFGDACRRFTGINGGACLG